ncbi:serine protease [Microcoleus anatoxicus]|uniref:S1 family peptidase n=1 Tax=Microcoleus anatoxicus TaxID=2705319 RepID=UPI0030C8F0D9
MKAISLACVCSVAIALQPQAINLAQSPKPSTTKAALLSDEAVSKKAKEITVKVFKVLPDNEEEVGGSGFIVKVKKRENATSQYVYLVLTNNHVIEGLKGLKGEYKIKTDDNEVHQAYQYKEADFKGNDLGLLSFSSSISYKEAEQGDSSTLKPEQKIFVAGFPCESNPCKSKFKIVPGLVAPLSLLLKNKTLVEGYRIGYDNNTSPGSSGGPVLTSAGKVVAINGKGKYPKSPIANAPNPYIFTDNSKPSPDIEQFMRYFAWGIPIETYNELAPQASKGGDTSTGSRSSTPSPSPGNTAGSQSSGTDKDDNIIFKIIILIVFLFGSLILILVVGNFPQKRNTGDLKDAKSASRRLSKKPISNQPIVTSHTAPNQPTIEMKITHPDDGTTYIYQCYLVEKIHNIAEDGKVE